MDEITLKNYRCFRDEQRARLAPLTLLVGENSTGKTSFLAMVRVLSFLAYGLRFTDFKLDPYDLGSFDEIAHHRGGRVGRADSFRVGLTDKTHHETGNPISLIFTFSKRGTAPVPTSLRLYRGTSWINETIAVDGPCFLQVGTSRGTWEVRLPDEVARPYLVADHVVSETFRFLWMEKVRDYQERGVDFIPLVESPPFSSEDLILLNELVNSHLKLRRHLTFASAPVRSKPRRTYDPSRPIHDPEGDYVPMYLADLSFRQRKLWIALKSRLERFGKESGLFDEISIRQLGKRGSEPFQVQIRRFGKGRKGPKHNLIDVGYGVSQALPVITELLRPDALSLFLLQQPEVHLHPSAQAALGSLFCQIAGPERQLVVETHSDYLLDRVRMEVRDARETGIKAEDVSILFFERNALDVQIHSLRIDKEGNIVDAPNSYRTFFMRETARLLGL